MKKSAPRSRRIKQGRSRTATRLGGQKRERHEESLHSTDRGDPEAALALLREWAAQPPEYDIETMTWLRQAVDEDRTSYRKLFPQEPT